MKIFEILKNNGFDLSQGKLGFEFRRIESKIFEHQINVYSNSLEAGTYIATFSINMCTNISGSSFVTGPVFEYGPKGLFWFGSNLSGWWDEGDLDNLAKGLESDVVPFLSDLSNIDQMTVFLENILIDGEQYDRNVDHYLDLIFNGRSKKLANGVDVPPKYYLFLIKMYESKGDNVRMNQTIDKWIEIFPNHPGAKELSDKRERKTT